MTYENIVMGESDGVVDVNILAQGSLCASHVHKSLNKQMRRSACLYSCFLRRDPVLMPRSVASTTQLPQGQLMLLSTLPSPPTASLGLLLPPLLPPLVAPPRPGPLPDPPPDLLPRSRPRSCRSWRLEPYA